MQDKKQAPGGGGAPFREDRAHLDAGSALHEARHEVGYEDPVLNVQSDLHERGLLKLNCTSVRPFILL